jgi:hypothetical protein
MLTVVATIAILLTSSLIAISQGWFQPKPKSEYVIFDLKLSVNPYAMVNTFTDNSNYPVVVTESYMGDGGVIQANVTINGVVYTYPEDFNYNFTGHLELNHVTGYGLEIIQETLTFKHLRDHPTIIGLAEEKVSGLFLPPENPLDISHYENLGNYQVTGTKMFRNVNGDGMGMLGQSTDLIVRHFALIKGWPL